MSLTETEFVMISCIVGDFMTKEITEDFEISFHDFIIYYDKDLKKLEDLYFYEVLF